MVKCRSKSGMTLIELLVAMAITAMMIGIAFPVFSQYQKRSAYISDAENLVQLINYARAYENNPDYVTRSDATSAMVIRFTNHSGIDRAELYSSTTGISKTIDKIDFLSDFKVISKEGIENGGGGLEIKISGKNPTEKIGCTGVGITCDEKITVSFYKPRSSITPANVEILNTVDGLQLFSVRIIR